MAKITVSKENLRIEVKHDSICYILDIEGGYLCCRVCYEYKDTTKVNVSPIPFDLFPYCELLIKWYYEAEGRKSNGHCEKTELAEKLAND